MPRSERSRSLPRPKTMSSMARPSCVLVMWARSASVLGGEASIAARSASVGSASARASVVIAQPSTASSRGVRSRCSTEETSAATMDAWRTAASASSPAWRCNGLSRWSPPGWSLTTVRPRCAARSAYSPFGSVIAIQRPRSPEDRLIRHFSKADLPTPGSPTTSMFGFVTRPSAYAANGSKENGSPPAVMLRPSTTPPTGTMVSTWKG